MKVVELNIGSTSALIIGEKSEKVFLFVHGLHGHKEEALLVSPILDMKRFIELMPQREDDYYEWVVNNPITSWAAPTYILRPEVDLIVSEEVGHNFISQHQCQVTIMPDGEHWFHTPEQLAFLKAWEEKTIISNE